MESSSKPNPKGHSCESCGKILSSKGGLRSHRKIHLAEKQFVCSLCVYSTNFSSRLKSHMLTHTTERPFKCPRPDCGATFKDKPGLKRHRLVHSRIPLKFKCSYCPYETGSKSGLWNHGKVHIVDAKMKSCDLCPYKANFRYLVSLHTKLVHDAARTREKRTRLENSMTGHQTIHSRIETPFSSMLCNISGRALLSGHLVANNQGQDAGALDSEQDCPFKGKDEKPEYLDLMSGVTHVQWSVDWGRTVYNYQAEDQAETLQSPTSSRTVIKVEG